MLKQILDITCSTLTKLGAFVFKISQNQLLGSWYRLPLTIRLTVSVWQRICLDITYYRPVTRGGSDDPPRGTPMKPHIVI